MPTICILILLAEESIISIYIERDVECWLYNHKNSEIINNKHIAYVNMGRILISVIFIESVMFIFAKCINSSLQIHSFYHILCIQYTHIPAYLITWPS